LNDEGNHCFKSLNIQLLAPYPNNVKSRGVHAALREVSGTGSYGRLIFYSFSMRPRPSENDSFSLSVSSGRYSSKIFLIFIGFWFSKKMLIEGRMPALKSK